MDVAVPLRFQAFVAFLPLAGAYFVAGKLGLTLAFLHASATPVWPPTGIALSAFLLLGPRMWPAILVGAFLVNQTTAGSVATSLGIAVGNTLEGLVGAGLVERFARGRRAFSRARDVFRFALLAGILSTAISATCGVTSLALGGYADWAAYGSIWLTWWLGDAAGALVVAPLLVLWGDDRRPPRERPRIVEAAMLLLALLVGGTIVFLGWLPAGLREYPLDFLCIPPLLWAAFRFGQREGATAMALLSGIAIAGTLQGTGPFARWTPNESLLLLQAFMATIAVTTLAIAAIVAERRRTEAEREQLIEELREALDHVRTLQGLLPICSGCNRIRDERGEWVPLQRYIEEHSEARFSHGLCPGCARALYPQVFSR